MQQFTNPNSINITSQLASLIKTIDLFSIKMIVHNIMVNLVSEGSGVKPGLTRDETQSMSNDAPLTAGYTTRSVKDNMHFHELMDLCATLFSKVSVLEVDLKKTKMLYAELQNQVKQLKVKKEDIVDSSSSSDSDEFYVAMRNFFQIGEENGVRASGEAKA